MKDVFRFLCSPITLVIGLMAFLWGMFAKQQALKDKVAELETTNKMKDLTKDVEEAKVKADNSVEEYIKSRDEFLKK